MADDTGQRLAELEARMEAAKWMFVALRRAVRQTDRDADNALIGFVQHHLEDLHKQGKGSTANALEEFADFA